MEYKYESGIRVKRRVNSQGQNSLTALSKKKSIYFVTDILNLI